MNRIFASTDLNKIYQRSMFASIAHALMSGKYSMLSGEIAWDGDNYLFQNMEGIKGVISFTRGLFICGIQNSRDYTAGTEEIYQTLLQGAGKAVIAQAEEEVLPYLLAEEGSCPAVTVLCFGNNQTIYSSSTEKEFMEKSNNILLPYLCEEKNMKAYWTDYYEMNSEQVALVEEFCQRRVTEGGFVIAPDVRDMLCGWFEEEIDICRKSLSEIGIVLP